jgi:hypothetical protein
MKSTLTLLIGLVLSATLLGGTPSRAFRLLNATSSGQFFDRALFTPKEESYGNHF